MRRLLALLFALIALLIWLFTSNSGLQVLAGFISNESLQISEVQGRLAGPLQIGRIQLQSADGQQIEVTQLTLDWSPARLLAGELRIAELAITDLHITPGPATPPSPPPSSLRSAFAVDLQKLAISKLRYGAVFSAEDLSAHVHSDGQVHHLADFHARSGTLTLSGQAELDGSGELPLHAQAELRGELAAENKAQPLHLVLSAHGPLREFSLSADGRAGLSGQASATLTPFAASAFSQLNIALQGLDPATWNAQWPSATLSLNADIAPQGAAIAGQFTLLNARPGTLDQGRLPLEKVDGRLHWQDGRAQLPALHIALPGKASLSGQASWGEEALQLDLVAKQLDFKQIHRNLRSTRLAGPISSHLGAQRQQLTIDLKDDNFRLRATAEHAKGLLKLAQLELAARDARLSAQGELETGAQGAFKFTGQLQGFDPARFAQLPAARLNADFSAHGQQSPQLALNAEFKIADSLLAGQPLSGQGQFHVTGERLSDSELQLRAGANRLDASGAFGLPGDTFTVDLAASQLLPFGLEGELNGQLRLGGSRQQPRLAGQLTAARFGVPGVFRLQQLALSGDSGGDAQSPLRIDLTLAALSTPSQPELARGVAIHASGSQREQRIDAAADLLAGNQLKLTLAGGLPDSSHWQGRLLEAQLRSKDSARNTRLQQAAPLAFSSSAWQIGPLTLAGEALDWRATLTAQADAQRLKLRADASGSRLGKLNAELDAGMSGAYALDGPAPWRGLISAQLAELSWLGDVIGEGWQSGGNLNARLELAGNPEKPVLSGQFRGDKLALRLPEQGLNLANGQLAIRLLNNRLRIDTLACDSLLQPLPRPLQLAGERTPESQAALAAIVARPGRLEISGEIAVDRSSGESAALDIVLDRVGAWQLPDQWLTLSGKARLNWQEGVLGLHGKLLADAGYWQLAPSGMPRLSDDVLIHRAGQPAAAASWRPRLDIDVVADLGQRFLFVGAGLSSRLAGEIRLSARDRDLPRASGNINARNGRFEAYGQKLDIERGVLHFQGLLDNPALDVRALRKGLPVEAGVQIGGTAQKPIVKLISDPELPDTEKLAWLVLGHGPEQMGAGDAPLLLAAAGGLLGNNAGGLVGQLKRTFGFDELGVRQGQIGDNSSRQLSSRVASSGLDTSSSTGTQIFSVGKRLSSNALLSYEQAIGKAESVVKLTVTLSRNLSLVGRAGSDNALDVFYTLIFGRAERQNPAISRKLTN